MGFLNIKLIFFYLYIVNNIYKNIIIIAFKEYHKKKINNMFFQKKHIKNKNIHYTFQILNLHF